MTMTANTTELLSSTARRQIVQTLTELPAETDADDARRTRADGMTAAELGEACGLHASTVRFHVDQLIDAGILTAHDVRIGVGRPRRHYTIAPTLAENFEQDPYRLMCALLADAMSAGDAATPDAAGERWVTEHLDELMPEASSMPPARTPGEMIAKLGLVVDLLERWGYTATVHSDGLDSEIHLSGCPLMALVRHNPAVTCGVHRGLLTASIAGLGEPDAHIDLTPMAKPDLCIARITTSREAHPEGAAR